MAKPYTDFQHEFVMMRSTFARATPIPQPSPLTYGGAGSVVSFQMMIHADHQLLRRIETSARLESPLDLADTSIRSQVAVANRAIDSFRTTVVDWSRNGELEGLPNTLVITDSYPGVSGASVFRDRLGAYAMAARAGYEAALSDAETRYSGSCNTRLEP